MKSEQRIFTALVAFAGALCAPAALNGAEQLLLQEGFETDGDGTRYVVIAGGDDGASDFVARRQVGSAGSTVSGGTMEGQWFFGFQDLDHAPGPRGSEWEGEGLTNRDARLKFQDIDISDMGNIRVQMAVANGGAGNEPNDDFWMRVRFDGGDWIEIGGFKTASSNSRPIYYQGPKDTMTLANDPNKIFRFFSDWSWPITGHGSTMELQITVSGNAGNEDHYIDNVRIYGNPEVRFVRATFESGQLTEPESGGVANPLTLTLDEPAPAGGATFSLQPSDTRSGFSLGLPSETVTIPSGETSLVVPIEILQDGQYTGTKTVDLFVRAPGYNPALARVIVENVTPKPNVVITEALNVVPGLQPEDLFGDANGDGRYHNTQDQFIEIVNLDTIPVDLSGWRMGEDLADRHLIPDGTILYPKQALVIFGGGVPRGTFGGAIVQLATAGGNGIGLNITSRAEIAYINAPFGAQVDLVNIPLLRADHLAVTDALPEGHAGKGVSASVHRTSLEPTGPGFTFSQDYIHSIIPEAGERLFSPGTWVDGTPYFDPENEITLTVSSTTIRESDGPNAATGTLTLASAAPAGGLEVTIETDGVVVNERTGTFIPREIDLDSLVIVIPEGQTSADFRIGAHNDGVLDGDKIVSIFARSGPYVLPGFVEMVVEDIAEIDVNVVINEIMSDVVGTAEDFNLDGNAEDSLGDQFVELVNLSDHPVNLSGWHLTWDSGGTFAVPRPITTIPEGTWLPAGGAYVVFGAISDAAAADPFFGGAVVQGAIDEDGLIKGDGVDLQITGQWDIKLYNRHGFLVHEIAEISNAITNQDQAITRAPDLTGDLALHLDAHLNAGGFEFLLASPGRDLLGVPFPGNGAIHLPFTFIHIERLFDDGLYLDPVFGWLGNESPVADSPWVYVVEKSAYWYIHPASGDGHIWVYDMSLQGWYYTHYAAYPWMWDYAASQWTGR
jgi:hypothetical protein